MTVWQQLMSVRCYFCIYLDRKIRVISNRCVNTLHLKGQPVWGEDLKDFSLSMILFSSLPHINSQHSASLPNLFTELAVIHLAYALLSELSSLFLPWTNFSCKAGQTPPSQALTSTHSPTHSFVCSPSLSFKGTKMGLLGFRSLWSDCGGGVV